MMFVGYPSTRWCIEELLRLLWKEIATGLALVLVTVLLWLERWW